MTPRDLREKRVNLEKKKMVKIYFLKLLLILKLLISVNTEANQLRQGTTKLFMDDLLLNGLPEKVICYLK